jgi:regulation of enolase protein 1 (concanavalin A-like superfamily)
MEKFSKGEWAIMPIEQDKEYIRIRGAVLGGKFKIANVSDLKNHHEDGKKWCEFDRAEPMANAHLIAAAPEMYSALRLISDLSILSEDKGLSDLVDDLLSKARGETCGK